MTLLILTSEQNLGAGIHLPAEKGIWGFGYLWEGNNWDAKKCCFLVCVFITWHCSLCEN